MKKAKQLGIWMDYSVAYLMELTAEPYQVQTIIHEDLNKVPSMKPDILKYKLSEIEPSNFYTFFNKIGDVMLNYSEIILSGPNNSKLELFDFLSENEKYLKLKIVIKSRFEMEGVQQEGFIREFF